MFDVVGQCFLVECDVLMVILKAGTPTTATLSLYSICSEGCRPGEVLVVEHIDGTKSVASGIKTMKGPVSPPCLYPANTSDFGSFTRVEHIVLCKDLRCMNDE